MEALVAQLTKANLFYIQADGSTDSGNVENVLYLVYFDPYSQDGKVHVRKKIVTIRRPARSNADGLYQCFTRALSYAGILIGRISW